MSTVTPNPGHDPPRFELARSPSRNYETAKATLVYRLSELTFGSILASYIFGFITFAASIVFLGSATPVPRGYGSLDPDLLTAAIQVLIYAFISGTYAYITAAMYMRYHLGILTMPTAAVERSRLDLTIAISQAGLFGISMLMPPSFFVCVAIVLLVTAFRQNREFRALTLHFTNAIQKRITYRNGTVSPDVALSVAEEEKKLSKAVQTTIKDSKLTGWRPVTTGHRIGTAVLFAIGIYLLLLPVLPSLQGDVFSWLRSPGIPPEESLTTIYCLASLVLFILVLVSAHGIMKEGSRFMHGPEVRSELDEHYLELEQSFRELYNVPANRR